MGRYTTYLLSIYLTGDQNSHAQNKQKDGSGEERASLALFGLPGALNCECQDAGPKGAGQK
jgi:hypothetical protein